ncbi:hypothetical protein EV421DRAFT_1910568 [Armillaria borealis]|uniref:AIG1-type G domain-containing protein n=1 Tax=Armillaria borealis TaxID=47425 RepID=A0AA39IYJ3_9AGAR|nr:hypothetical protein EV421DRAFT_1910568 [Armillaria borealis]
MDDVIGTDELLNDLSRRIDTQPDFQVPVLVPHLHTLHLSGYFGFQVKVYVQMVESRWMCHPRHLKSVDICRVVDRRREKEEEANILALSRLDVLVSEGLDVIVINKMTLAITATQYYPVDDEAVERILNDVESLSRGKVKTDRNKQKEFTIPLVGETGVGKTAVLSLTANVLAGKRPDNYEEFYDHDNEAGRTETHVNGVTVRILDFPGLADTRGIQRDELHTKSIVEAIQDSIVSVNAVLILANGTVPRLTVGADYALSTLSAIFPHTLADNIGFLFTNVSSPLSWNFDLGSLPNAFQGNMQFLLDNPVMMQNICRQMEMDRTIPVKTKRQLRQAVLAGEGKALDTLVEMFDWLNGLKPQPTTDIMSLYDQLQKIEAKIANTLAIMHQAAKTDNKLDDVQRKLDGAKVDMKTREKCSQSERMVHEVDRPTQHDVLRNCIFTLESGGVYCQECKHGREFHRHFNLIWAIREVSELHVNQEAKAKFENALNAKKRAEELKKQIKDRKALLQDRINNVIEELGRLVERYSSLSLSGSFAGQVEKVVKMLEQNLEGMRESGAARETIDKVEASLDSMREKLEVLKEANRSRGRCPF